MTNQDLDLLKNWFTGFARLYHSSLNPELSADDVRFAEREMNRIATCILAQLPRVPEQAILIPNVGETYAITIDPDWHEFPSDKFYDAFIVTPCISLKSAVKPMELVG